MMAKSVVNVSAKSEGVMNSVISLRSSSVLLLPIILMVFKGSWGHCIRVLLVLYGTKKVELITL
jgi:hypothetical protein